MKQIIISLVFLFFTATHFIYGGDIKGKLIVGYQGWFNCKDDGSPLNSWVHWGGGTIGPRPGFGNLHFDLYPDVREYTNTYQTGLGNLNNGQPAKLFSSYDDQVVNKHVEWMQQYGIDVVALQRFSSGVTPGSTKKAHKDGMALKIRNACEIYGRKFYMMYDLSDMAMDTSFIDILRKDWTNTITSASALNLLASPAYAKEMVNGVLKPVVCIWGFGSKDRPGDVNSYKTLVNWFKNVAGCYVIIGGIKSWRTNTTLLPAFKLANMISPWSVGSFGDESGANSYANGTMQDDFKFCTENNIDYLPVVFPGFTWANWKAGYENKRNDKPRMHGNFMWRQFYNVKSKGIPNVYVAMFDEFDEGTAIAKAAENTSMIPNNQWFLTLDADGVACSSDFYLRLTGDGAKMIKGIIPLTSEHPTSHTQSLTPGIVLTPAASTMNIGNTLQLNATEYPVNETNKPFFFK
jgi:hypothetical protein